MFKEVLEEVPLDCPHCDVRLEIDTPNMRSLWEAGAVTCRACHRALQLIDVVERGHQAEAGDAGEA